MRRLLFGLLISVTSLSLAAENLPSWNDSTSKKAILAFVEQVTTPGTSTFIPTTDRIAVFDNDGTLWSEQPIYVQLAFLIDRIKALAPQHPDWQTTQPFKAVLENDMPGILRSGEQGLLQLLAASHAGMTNVEFRQTVRDWLVSAKHPTTNRSYIAMVYQPMLELLDYLRANGFKTYVVSGGGREFMRAWVQEVYGIPPEQVIGSSLESKFEMRDGVPAVVRTGEIGFVNDKEGKPVAIDNDIGKRPIIAVGNSDGDLQMLQWTSAGDGPRLGVIVHHTDAVREFSYDRDSKVGQLDQALELAPQMGWTVVNMKNDWRVIFPGN